MVRYAAISMTVAVHQVALGTTDLDRSAAFYSDVLRANPSARFDPPGLLFFQIGDLRLLLERHSSVEPGPSVVYFLVDDVQSEVRRLRNLGVVFDSEPHLIHVDQDGTFGAPGTQEWMAFFRDPDQNSLALIERRPRSIAA